jgi:UDP-4-amino-4-deoxy-L-arabinose-oxoglutarate aminotransferase
MKVDFFLHSLTSSEYAPRIGQVLDTPFLTSGAVGKAVEAQLCEFFGVGDAMLVNSWTNGALAVLLALGIGPGDEVIVPAMTFIATANVVELLGAKPVFVDVNPDTLLLEPAAVAAAITPRTRAIVPVHLYGQMCDMQGFRDVSQERPGIAVIEDCAHCFEGSRDGCLPGRYSTAAIFSFYATKNVTCGEGGAVIVNSPELAAKVRQTRLHGMSQGAVDRFERGEYRHWDMPVLGVKANLPDLLAAYLEPQIATVRERLPKRQAIANRYRAAFQGTSIRMQKLLPACSSAEHLFPIAAPPAVRDEAIAALTRRDIGVAVNYRSVPTLTYYREKYGYRPDSFPVSYEWGAGTLTLPLYPALEAEKQDWVISSVLEEVAPLCRDAAEPAIAPATASR